MERKVLSLFPVVLLGLLVLHGEGSASHPAACGPKVSFNTSSSIQLPSLTAGQNCTWTISHSKTTTMALLLKDALIAPSDSLVIYDGVVASPNMVMNFSGTSVMSNIPAVFERNATIIFHVGANASGSAGTIVFNVLKCELTLNNTFGLRLTNPAQVNTKKNLSCLYNVKNNLPLGRMAVVSFADFSFNNVSQLTMSSGKKEVNYTGGKQTELADFYPDFTSANGEVNVTFTIKDSDGNQSFSLVFDTLIKACTEEVPFSNATARMDLILDLPTNPPVACACRQVIKDTGHGAALLINVTELQLFTGSDTLKLIDGVSSQETPVVQIETDQNDYLILGSSSSMIVALTLGDGNTPRTLEMNIVRLNSGGRYQGSGMLKAGAASPKADQEEEKSESVILTAYYQMVALQGLQVSLTLLTPLVDNATLTLYRGLQPSNDVFVELDATSLAKGVNNIVGGPSMLAVLTNFPVDENFTANFESIQQGCNQLVTASTGQLLYVMDKANGTATCTWIFAPEVKGLTVLTFDSLNLGKNDTVTIYDGPTTTTAIAQFVGPVDKGPFPQATLSQGVNARVVITRAKLYRPKTNVVVNYKVVAQVCGGPLSVTGTLTTPNYPNQYPLNSQCMWSVPVNYKQFYLSFQSLDLTQNHSLSVLEEVNATTADTLATYMGSAMSSDQLPVDLIVPSTNQTVVTFSSAHDFVRVTGQETDQVGTGLKVNYWLLSCGGNASAPNGTFTSPGYPKAAAAMTQCVWIINLPPTDDDSYNQSVRFSVTVKGAQAKNIDKYLKIHDGPSSRFPLSPADASNGTSGVILSRYDTLILLFHLDAATKDKVAVNVTYSTYMCNSSMQCDNKICLHPDWVCNHKDDCGDNSDEQNCVFPRPTPAPPQNYSGWVKTVWVPTCFFIGILIGAVLYFIIPRVIRRFRGTGNNYSHMDDSRQIVA